MQMNAISIILIKYLFLKSIPLYLMRVFVPKRGDNGEWRMLRNKVLHNLYRSPNIVRVIKSRRLSWAGHVARMEEGKPTGKRPLGSHRRRWEDNIIMDLE